MNDIKHTPGPWTFDPNGGLPVIQIYCSDNKNPFHGSRSDAEQIANAVLMAAAPELLEALQDALTLLWPSTDEHQKALAAIAKATGEA